jgi:succinylglutamate desuccinylase
MKQSSNIVAEKISRIIGLIEGPLPGPTVVAFGGMHGNEPAGVNALQNVIENLETKIKRFKGRFLALRGNVEALQRNVRYVDEDMNRIWFPSIIDKIRRTSEEDLESSERREIKSVLHLLDKFLTDESEHPTIFADLHSFSAEGGMFAITARKTAHINLFSKLHVPLIFGIEKTLQGTALRYYQDLGFVTFALEGGQHQNKITVKNNTAAMLAMLDEVGCLDTTDMSAFDEHQQHLAQQNKQLPKQVKLAYQHMIEPGDDFEMRQGFRNFQIIKKGEWLATDQNGKIEAQCGGYLLMPLYQEQGNDGFFIVQDHQDG